MRMSLTKRPTFTVVIPTLGRPGLPLTLESARHENVEIIVVADTYRMMRYDVNTIREIAESSNARFLAVDADRHDHGSPQLQAGYECAECSWIMNLGDDDLYEPLAFETMQRAIDEIGEPMPMMFRSVLHPGPQRGNTVPVVLWHEPVLERSKMTGQCFVIPNDQSRIGSWLPDQDVGHITETVRLWGGRIAWRTEVLAQCY